MTGLRVVAIADADSFVKWSAALLGSVPEPVAGPGLGRRLVIVRTPLTVSAEQERTALAGTGFTPDAVTRLSFAELSGWLTGHLPDVVLLAGRGPFVRLIARVIDRLPQRPVVVSGLPGMAIPAQRGALEYRRESDLLVLHSHREIRAFEELGRRIGVEVRTALATLPFAAVPLVERTRPETERLETHLGAGRVSTRSLAVSSLNERGKSNDLAPSSDERGTATALAERLSSTSLVERARPEAERVETPRTDLVFAAQALVPADRSERALLAGILRRAAEADPGRRVVVKLRARVGEAETHQERDSYAELLADRPANLVFSYAPMAEALAHAEGLVTVSSTAAVEAIAHAVPVIALDVFGVHKALLNTVFVGSGLLGGSEEVVGRRFRHPHPAWLEDNYFHRGPERTWWDQVEELVAQRRAGVLPAKVVPAGRFGALHAAWHRASVLGAEDRSLSGAVALGVGAPLVRGIVGMRRARGRAGADTWADASTDWTLEPTPHRDPIRR